MFLKANTVGRIKVALVRVIQDLYLWFFDFDLTRTSLYSVMQDTSLAHLDQQFLGG